jgi:pimeloyl-[acyl-carrier protein] synthase
MPMSKPRWMRPVLIRALLTGEWWHSGVTYHPLTPRMARNPYPAYAQLRTRDPVHWSVLAQSWVFSRYRDIEAILRDHTRFSNEPHHRQPPRPLESTGAYPRGPSMLFSDPPDHARLRALVQQAFTPRAIEALAPRIRRIAADLLDHIADPTAFDLMDAFATPLPVLVVAELLGVPPADQARLAVWSQQRARILEPVLTGCEPQEALQAAHALDAYFLDLLDQRRVTPEDDLISALVATEAAGDRLTQDELLVMLRLLLVAGHETTTNLIGNGLLALLRHPEQLQLLRDNPSLMQSAVEELLRYDAPVQVDSRTALEAMAWDGRQIQPGQEIVLLLGAANHDPEVFDHPEQLDITRHKASHLAFGRGIHHCLGAPLARLEVCVALELVLERFAEIRLRMEDPPFKETVVLRGLKVLPVAAQPARPHFMPFRAGSKESLGG